MQETDESKPLPPQPMRHNPWLRLTIAVAAGAFASGCLTSRLGGVPPPAAPTTQPAPRDPGRLVRLGGSPPVPATLAHPE